MRARLSNMIAFDNSYARLPEHFYVRLDPTTVADPRLIRLNRQLCVELGIDPDALADDEWARVVSGNRLLPGSEPLAMAYAGHQFGHLAPRLGDGRAILLGEVMDRSGTRRDIHLKGTGRTPFSRGGDGRAALGPVLREYLLSEAMHALGIPTTRALAAVTTGEQVYREVALPGAILARVASGLVRVGTFEYFAVRGDVDALHRLADYVISRHQPDLAHADAPYRALLEGVVELQAGLVAHWMQVGFIHGVMNTDNCAVSGETIDFGPCAFMDAYDPDTVYSSVDQQGRYAYANQPGIAHWNLARFAEALLPILDSDRQRALDHANGIVSAFPELFDGFWLAGMRRKLGLFTADDGDTDLARSLLDVMHQQRADFTLTFRHLCDAVENPDGREAVRNLFADPRAFDAWALRWQERLAGEPGHPSERATAMRQVNPAFIPRNHNVEHALDAAVREGDFSPFETLLSVLSRPYENRTDYAEYTRPPNPEEEVRQTFCGT